MKVKKILGFILAILLIAVLAISVWQVVAKKNNDVYNTYAYTNLFSKYGYKDYAKEAKFDLEKDPELNKTGLFWDYWDDSKKEIVKVKADTKEGAALIDVNKPTIIMVHGMQSGVGQYIEVQFQLNKNVAIPAEFNLDTENVPMMYLWLREGWNVGEFHYEKFCSNPMPNLIEEKIWSTDTGALYQKKDNSWSNPMPFSVAEYFVGDYLRAMNLLPESMGNKEIRVAAHSMGGQLTTAGLFLLSEMVSDGQLKAHQFPDRYSMMDTYFGASITLSSEITIGAKDVNINWSGKPLYQNNTGATMIECIRIMKEKYGLVCEYYVNEMSFLKLGMEKYNRAFRELCSYTLLNPDWSNYGGYNQLTNGHNGNMEWYLCSIVNKNGIKTVDGKPAPSASMSTEQLKKLAGKQYKIYEGAQTVYTEDDVMQDIYFIKYELNGGTLLINTYFEYYESVTKGTHKLTKPELKGYEFVGYFDEEGKELLNIDDTNKEKVFNAKWKKEGSK